MGARTDVTDAERRRLIEILSAEDDILVGCHVQPDGDALGSLLALGLFLKEQGKIVHMGWGERMMVPPQYRFLPGIDLLTPTGMLSPRVLVTVDAANRERLGALRPLAETTPVVINIDHHPDNERFGHVNLVEPGASSVAEILYGLFQAWGRPISQPVALCLYVGIVTDTGRFQYSNTSSRTLRVAADLVELGINPTAVFQNLYEHNPFSWIKIVGRGLDRAVFLEELGLVYTVLRADDFRDTGSTMAETENLIDWLRSVEGAEVAAVLKELPDGKVKVSLRSKGRVDVGRIAGEMGGGGHHNAAGFVSSESVDPIIKSLSEKLAAAGVRRQR